IGLVYTLSRRGGRLPVEGLLLSGVVINVIFSSLILFFISTAHQSTVRDAIWWLLGSLEIFDPWLLLIAALFVLAGCAVCFSFYRELDALSLGEEEALHLGIDTERVSTILFITASLMTAVLVSICGLIGFVGLIVPHIARSFVGSGHRYLVPATALIGAILLIAGDVLGRTLLWPIEIPIGVVTSILGGPFFLYLLARGKGGRWR
ncbi:MAG: iron ABC transporter permease, partial [Candidatus Omnitrophota bacterium]